MEKKSFYTKANGIDFYCELRGEGPTLVFVPDGGNDCGPYDAVSEYLKHDFTVLSFDMRGSVRSNDPNAKSVTPRLLSDDVAAIIKEIGLSIPASFYGCSSGGQTVLSLALYHPEICRNVIVHEAALQGDAPIQGAGFEYFKTLETYAPYCVGFAPGDIGSCANYDKWAELDADTRARMDKNSHFWSKYYLGSVDTVTYSKDDLTKMKNVDFSVGAWSAAWAVYANIATAERGDFPYYWQLSAHLPHITCPERLAEFILKTCRKYS